MEGVEVSAGVVFDYPGEVGGCGVREDVARFRPAQEVGEGCEAGRAEVEGFDGFRGLGVVSGGDRDCFWGGGVQEVLQVDFGDFEEGLGALVDYDGYGFGEGSASENVRFEIAFRKGGGENDLP